MTHEEDLDFERGEMLGWEESEMERLADHLRAGKKISRDDLAQVLRVTMNTEIPTNVRQAIIDLLDPEVKTGRSRRPKFFYSAEDDFRDLTIRERYKELHDSGMKDIDAMEKVGEQFHLGYERIRDIVKSKNKS